MWGKCGENANQNNSEYGHFLHSGSFYLRNDRYKRNIKNCSGIPGITDSVKTENLVTFELNYCYKNDVYFVT